MSFIGGVLEWEKVWSGPYIKCQDCELRDEFEPRRHASHPPRPPHSAFVPCSVFFLALFVLLAIFQNSRRRSSLSGSQMNEAGRE